MLNKKPILSFTGVCPYCGKPLELHNDWTGVREKGGRIIQGYLNCVNCGVKFFYTITTDISEVA